MTTRIQAFDFSLDLMSALLWQYNDALRLQSLVEKKQAWADLNYSEFWTDWVTDVFDLRTANDFGLAVWAIILDMPVVLRSNSTVDQDIWAFGQYRQTFNNGNFAPSESANLTTEQKRILLRLRYFQLITRGAVPEINTFLKYLFEDEGVAFVTDGLAMNARYAFLFPLASGLETLFQSFDILPRPAGVKADLVIVLDFESWAFGPYRQTFNNGNFYHG